MAHRKQKDPYAPTQRRPGAQRPERLPTGPGRARELAISGEPQTCGDARDARRGLIAQQSADEPVPAKEESKPVPVHCPPRLRLSWVGRPRFSRARATRAHVHLCGGMFERQSRLQAGHVGFCLSHCMTHPSWNVCSEPQGSKTSSSPSVKACRQIRQSAPPASTFTDLSSAGRPADARVVRRGRSTTRLRGSRARSPSLNPVGTAPPPSVSSACSTSYEGSASA
mmetsp:Transcript_1377/g.4795  ORF Transcript_1377/g.4795 Transcript_1377/m.4795 type:complete len:225 (-) Transcript_1377:147-821(-)